MKTKLFLVSMNIFLIFLLTISFVNAPVTIGTLYSCESADPVINGTLDPIEWKEGIPLRVTLYNLLLQSDSIDIEIMSVHGRDNLLYFGITIEDDDINPEDFLYIVFNTSRIDPIIVGANVTGHFTKELDLKLIWFHNNGTLDYFTKDTGFDRTVDTDVGGVNNGVGKVHSNTTHVTIEMKFPFNSGDTLGHDFSLAVNSKIDIFLWYHDEDKMTDYTQIRSTDLDWDVIELAVNCTGVAPLSLIAILFGAIFIALTQIIIKKKK